MKRAKGLTTTSQRESTFKIEPVFEPKPEPEPEPEPNPGRKAVTGGHQASP
jgi:hypothetical protein